jgi:antitoxin component YwqK of YwqJK toxin-antitoxin module
MRKRTSILAALVAAALLEGSAVLVGAPDRVVHVFGSDGRVIAQTAFRDGRKVGRQDALWPDGSLKSRAYFDGDILIGTARAWHANGRTAEVKRYVDGRPRGLQQAWTDRGELFLNFDARNGRNFGLVNAKPCDPVAGSM